ncbi:unnamed protein product [Taenia asiatica]|uniref:Uncharacterized protein n=1 Tax=Taenia asiatica TaxID=60517 RepID=A0A3P6NZM6_TAEAS|nr:unnamed protein product [Taenia asiatica]
MVTKVWNRNGTSQDSTKSSPLWTSNLMMRQPAARGVVSRPIQAADPVCQHRGQLL